MSYLKTVGWDRIIGGDKVSSLTTLPNGETALDYINRKDQALLDSINSISQYLTNALNNKQDKSPVDSIIYGLKDGGLTPLEIMPPVSLTSSGGKIDISSIGLNNYDINLSSVVTDDINQVKTNLGSLSGTVSSQGILINTSFGMISTLKMTQDKLAEKLFDNTGDSTGLGQYLRDRIKAGVNVTIAYQDNDLIINASGGGGGGGGLLLLEDLTNQVSGHQRYNLNYSSGIEAGKKIMLFYNGVLQIEERDYVIEYDRKNIILGNMYETWNTDGNDTDTMIMYYVQ